MNIEQLYKQVNTKRNYVDTELLLAHVLGKPREYLLAHTEVKLTPAQIRQFKLLLNQRRAGFSLAYLTGHKEFYGLDFTVNNNVLVPRPETELMVEEGLEILKRSPETTVIDVGTGTGCIIISLIYNFQFIISKQFLISNFQKNYKFFASDISKDALAVARKNAKKHNLDKLIKFTHGNLLEPIIKNHKFLILNSKFLITANLPYLTPAQIKNAPSIRREPKLALDGGRDGLKYYRELFKQIKQLRETVPTREITVLCEIDPSQKLSIKRLAKRILPEAETLIKKDLRGHSRLAVLGIKN